MSALVWMQCKLLTISTSGLLFISSAQITASCLLMLSCITYCTGPALAAGWTKLCSEVPSNPHNSVILCDCEVAWTSLASLGVLLMQVLNLGSGRWKRGALLGEQIRSETSLVAVWHLLRMNIISASSEGGSLAGECAAVRLPYAGIGETAFGKDMLVWEGACSRKQP